MSFNHTLRAALAAVAIAGLTAGVSRAATITLSNQNSVAVFNTEASDPGLLGLNSWTVDGVDHMNQQWFWHRVGSHSREWAIDGTGPLAHFATNGLDLDADSFDDALVAEYRDTETILTPESYSLQFRYFLSGAAAGSNTSSLVEVIQIRNLGTQPLELHLFQYVDFDLNNTPGDDRIVLTGTPVNTATQSDPINIIGETVATPPPQRYEVDDFDDIRDMLDDGDIDNLSNTVGPLTGNATWAFQWDYDGVLRIPVGGSALISKGKSMLPGDGGIVPEPSSIVMAGLGLLGALWSRRRRAA